MASETKRLSISMTPEKQEKLDAITNSLDCSLNWLINQALIIIWKFTIGKQKIFKNA